MDTKNIYMKQVKQNKNEACKSSKRRIKVQKKSLFSKKHNYYLKADYDFLTTLSDKMGGRNNGLA